MDSAQTEVEFGCGLKFNPQTQMCVKSQKRNQVLIKEITIITMITTATKLNCQGAPMSPA